MYIDNTTPIHVNSHTQYLTNIYCKTSYYQSYCYKPIKNLAQIKPAEKAKITTFRSKSFQSLGTTYGSSFEVATLISCAAQTKMKEVTTTLRTGLLGMSTRTP